MRTAVELREGDRLARVTPLELAKPDHPTPYLLMEQFCQPLDLDMVGVASWLGLGMPLWHCSMAACSRPAAPRPCW